MVQRHWQDAASSAHFRPLQGRQLGLGDGSGGGDGGTTVGGRDGIGGDDGGGRVGRACVLDRGGVYVYSFKSMELNFQLK